MIGGSYVYDRYGLIAKFYNSDNQLVGIKVLDKNISRKIFRDSHTLEYDTESGKQLFIREKDRNKINTGDTIIQIGNIDYSDNPYEVKDIIPSVAIKGEYRFFVLMLENKETIKGNSFI